MIIIRGKVDPGRTNERVGAFRSLFGSRRWNMEYAIRDRNGRTIDGGSFKADPSGNFTLSLNAPTPGKVEIRVAGSAAYAGDCCTVDIVSQNDLVNLPRRLTPMKSLSKTNAADR
ncbi:MAG: hypothetical protein JSW58_13095 [Candidatus Latescibacterota bacterium]|nr:MAG: hypothetical protein JSW58_13095 [Candidatus Latescibacterota bacterium]